MMPWYIAVAVGMIPLSTCYLVFPWFRAAVKRRILFKPLGYDALSDILVEGMPEHVSIECLQAKYQANLDQHTHVDIYRYKDGVAAIRMKVDVEFPVARIFRDVLNANISPLALKSSKPPKIIINHSLYQVQHYSMEEEYLFIYVKHH